MYKPVCVSFLYTDVRRESSGCGITIVSRKEIDPSALASSVVNWMCGSMLLMCSRNSSFLTESMTTQVSFTYLFQILGRVLSCINDLGLKVLHKKVAHSGAHGRPHSHSLKLFKEPALKLEIGGL